MTTATPPDAALLDAVAAALRRAGAVFALVFGSRARGTAHPGSDLDVAAWWPADPPSPWELELPAGVDLVVIDGLPLELAGRIALDGTVLFEDDPAARVRWVAQTRKIWLDERPRFERSHREFLEAVARGR
jgi:predicted nucleotidyltransferase